MSPSWVPYLALIVRLFSVFKKSSFLEIASLSRNETFGMENNAISLLCQRNKDGIHILFSVTDNDSEMVWGREFDKTAKGMKYMKHFSRPQERTFSLSCSYCFATILSKEPCRTFYYPIPLNNGSQSRLHSCILVPIFKELNQGLLILKTFIT